MKKIISGLIFILTASLSFGQANGLIISNKASGGSMGTASTTVDAASLFNLNQTTSGQIISIPVLTNSTNGKSIQVNNTGSVSFTLTPGGVIQPGFGAYLRWTGSAWNVSGVGFSGGGGGNASLTQVITNSDTSHAPSGDAVFDQLFLKVDKSGSKVLSDVNYTAVEQTKLAGIAIGATANSSDAFLLARANHTGTQSYTTITGLGGVAILNIGTTSGTVAAGDDSRFAAINAAVQAALDLKLNLSSFTDAGMSTTDITTNNASTSKHGFLKKLSGTSTQYMDGSGNWSTPAGSGTDSSTFATKYFVNTGLATKQNTITAGTTSQYRRGDNTWQTLDKTAVGLSNVDNTSDANKPVSTAQAAADALKVTANANITGATKTKITYGINGLITAGADATTADIAASTNKNYITDAQQTVIQNTSGTNTGDQTNVTGNSGTATALQTSRNIDGQAFNGGSDITVIAPGTHAATSKGTPVDADEFPIANSASSFALGKLTWANLKATLNTYFATLFQPVNSQCNISSTAIDWNCTHSYKTGITTSTTFTFSNAANGKTIVFSLTNSTGTNTLTWPTVSWLNAGAPAPLSSTATIIITFVQINGIVYGSYIN